jgi:hypothetical protein
VESPVLLLDLGLLSITSTPKIKSNSLTSPESPQKALQNDEKGKQEYVESSQSNEKVQGEKKERLKPSQDVKGNTEFYDEFHLSMSNIQLVLINKVIFCFLYFNYIFILANITFRKRKSNLWTRSALIFRFSIA